MEVKDVSIAGSNPEIPLIDSRDATRYRGEEEPIDPVAGHIPGALNLPFTDNLNAEGFWLEPKQVERTLQGSGQC